MARNIVTDTESAIKTQTHTTGLAERAATFRRFMTGCNPTLLRQIEAGHVEIRRGLGGYVRLVEGSHA